MPGGTGLDVARAIQAEGLAAVPVFLTMYKDEQTFETAIATGVKGYVLKDCVLTEIVDCVRSVAAGGTYATPAPYERRIQARAAGESRSIPLCG